MIHGQIKIHPENVYVPPPTTYESSYKKPEKFTESTMKRIDGPGLCTPTETEYAQAVKEWAERGITAVGQKVKVQFHPQGVKTDRVFTKILPREHSNTRYQGPSKKVEIIEVWSPEHDSFMRVCPEECSKE